MSELKYPQIQRGLNMINYPRVYLGGRSPAWEMMGWESKDTWPAGSPLEQVVKDDRAQNGGSFRDLFRSLFWR
jgi:hypothetical protein